LRGGPMRVNGIGFHLAETNGRRGEQQGAGRGKSENRASPLLSMRLTVCYCGGLLLQPLSPEPPLTPPYPLSPCWGDGNPVRWWVVKRGWPFVGWGYAGVLS